ncbi:MAG: hypothetical protein ABW001_04245 [Mycobacterium sp.]
MRAQDEAGALVRGEAVRVLTALSESAKAQQAFLNSCSDATWISGDERSAIRWLLAALIDHRRRVRVAIRLWRTLTAGEQASSELVSETAELLDENSHFAPFISQWRDVVIHQTRMERTTFWRRMVELAELNIQESRETDEPWAATAR